MAHLSTPTEAPAPARQATYREVLAEPVFRLLFITQALAIAAESLRVLALSVLIYQSTSSPLLGALAFGAGFLPQLAGSALFGSVADRVRRRPLIVVGYSVGCVAAVGRRPAMAADVGCADPVRALAILARSTVTTGAAVHEVRILGSP